MQLKIKNLPVAWLGTGSSMTTVDVALLQFCCCSGAVLCLYCSCTEAVAVLKFCCCSGNMLCYSGAVVLLM